MTETGHRKGQFLLELDRDDVYTFSTVCLRAARDLPDMVEEAKSSARKIPQVPRYVTDFQRFARSDDVSLTAMAYVAESPFGYGDWLPLFASDCPYPLEHS